MTIAIFSSGVAPVAGTGLNMFKNGTCVFRQPGPFIYRNVTYTPGWDWQDIGPRMIMLGRYGYDSRVNGGWNYLKWLAWCAAVIQCVGPWKNCLDLDIQIFSSRPAADITSNTLYRIN
jgi:hypothetical protein